MQEYRCPVCNRLLFESDAPLGSVVQTHCHSCGAIRTVRVVETKAVAHNTR
jgi:phage FluMu protein Com